MLYSFRSYYTIYLIAIDWDYCSTENDKNQWRNIFWVDRNREDGIYIHKRWKCLGVSIYTKHSADDNRDFRVRRLHMCYEAIEKYTKFGEAAKQFIANWESEKYRKSPAAK